MEIDLWLYGPLARYAGATNQGSHAHVQFSLADGATVADLLKKLGIPEDEKGITFVNAQLSDMPGMAADRERGTEGWRPGGHLPPPQHVALPVPLRSQHQPAAEGQDEPAAGRRPAPLSIVRC